jgi:hypothetical protein
MEFSGIRHEPDYPLRGWHILVSKMGQVYLGKGEIGGFRTRKKARTDYSDCEN